MISRSNGQMTGGVSIRTSKRVTNALNGNGAGVIYSVKQLGTGGATEAGVWQYTAPAGKKIANAVLTYYAADGPLTYDAKDRSLRLAVAGNYQANWGANGCNFTILKERNGDYARVRALGWRRIIRVQYFDDPAHHNLLAIRG